MMMWYAVFNILSGELFSVGTVVADPLPAALAVKSLGEALPVGEWDETRREYVDSGAQNG